MTDVVIIGAGGHGREVLASLDALIGNDARVTFVGFLDDHEPEADLLARMDAEWLGPVSSIAALPSGTQYLIGIGAGATRRAIDAAVSTVGLQPFTLVHPTAVVGRDVRLEPGAIIFPLATVTTNISVGRHAHVGRGVALGHDCVLDPYVSIYPNASVSGNVHLGEAATVGTGASIRQGVTIAAESTVGMGAVVVGDVSGVVAGVPARSLG